MCLMNFPVLTQVLNAICSFETALTLIVGTSCQATQPELKVPVTELMVSAATYKY
jgi:hypothetical protein